jgi:hypothetical protein
MLLLSQPLCSRPRWADHCEAFFLSKANPPSRDFFLRHWRQEALATRHLPLVRFISPADQPETILATVSITIPGSPSMLYIKTVSM